MLFDYGRFERPFCFLPLFYGLFEQPCSGAIVAALKSASGEKGSMRRAREAGASKPQEQH
ncbi:hypothetical protein VSR68_18255 [Paraburkholderia phymatum]|uniref:hypothetical protein n=1 Tax=Paraburkholderia phymatum TaxID=148447 RepID=UPI00318260EF